MKLANVFVEYTQLSVRMGASNATGPIGRISKRIGQYVNHDVLVRFVSPWLVVAGVFTEAWIQVNDFGGPKCKR